MIVRISGIKLPPSFEKSDIKTAVQKVLHCKPEDITSCKIAKKSLDARDKSDIKFILSIDVELPQNPANTALKLNNVTQQKTAPYTVRQCGPTQNRPVIIGSGPAGLFCAYVLAKAGLSPIIIERGEPVPQRVKTVAEFFSGGKLNPHSNVQFGEGGAGTFSDGKLNTGVKDPRIKFIFETFVKFGADSSILYEAKPHIGTDILRSLTVNFRQEIERLGGKFHFSSKLADISCKNGKIYGISLSNGKEIECNRLILAIGHSARDTFQMLHKNGLHMEAKPFSVGVRIEHSRKFINLAQHGKKFAEKLPAADYKLVAHLQNGRTVYSFCMCPGGSVVAAASEPGGVVTNGMSYFARDGANSNSALLVAVAPEDYPSTHPLSGIDFQRKIEQKAYALTGSFSAPAQTLDSFLYGESNFQSNIAPTYRPGVAFSSLDDVFPQFVTNSLRAALPIFNRKINGFADKSAVLTAPETRSSSPVRMVRNGEFESSISGIYPCGEGAGYAGGITSSAIDGVKVAEMIIEKASQP